MAKTTDAHPMNLFRVNMAAMGMVLPKVLEMSLDLSFGTGVWYGIMRSSLRMSFLVVDIFADGGVIELEEV